MGQSQEKWLGYYSAPRKRHMPLKRYRVRATLSDGGIIYLVVRAHSKKEAKKQASKNYKGLKKAEVTEVLGKSQEEDYFI